MNDIHRENCILLNSVQETIKIEVWLFLTLFLCFTQSIKFPYILLPHIKEYTCFKNLINQIDGNERLLL